MLCGKLRLGEIARETALTAATTSDAVSTLESKGLVEKRRALDDGRALALRLTARGRTAARRAAQWPDFLAKAVGTLRDEEQSLFYRTLLKTVRQLEVQGHIPPHRMCVTCVHFEPGKNPKKTAHHCALLDLSMADTDLRLDCSVHETADAATQKKTWKIFAQQAPADPCSHTRNVVRGKPGSTWGGGHSNEKVPVRARPRLDVGPTVPIDVHLWIRIGRAKRLRL